MNDDINQEKEDKLVFGLKEFAPKAGYSVRQLRRLIKRGNLKASKIPGGRKWIIEASEIKEFKARMESGVKVISPNNFEKLKRKHIYQLYRVVKTLLSGGLGGIKLTGEDEYEYDRADDEQYPGEIVPFTLHLQEVRKSLHHNIEKAYDRHRNYDLFDYFLIHLTSSIPGFPNPDKADLHKLADASPLKLIDNLKMLALKKDFKGKCPVCKDWE